MLLHSRIIGEGNNIIVILHGLFGSGDNWKTYANKLEGEGFCIHLIDQRNHGRSFHSNEFNYNLLVKDLKYYLDHNKIHNCILIGHSMGGKTAMNFALKHTEYVSELIIIDIAPKHYPIHHDKIIETLVSLDLNSISSRGEAEQKLSKHIDDIQMKNFLLKNLYWIHKDKLAFRFNLSSLSNNISNIGEGVQHESNFLNNTLFLKGEYSNYINDNDKIEITKYFPKASIITIPNSNHWLHIDNPDNFFDIILDFIRDKY
ncbi:MAG: alpha/beta fold hydrolase [Bacteroidota bacterium]|mgnify:FL=1|nr:alpha/beta fold hydrolase [Bacteroidota bacterium]